MADETQSNTVQGMDTSENVGTQQSSTQQPQAAPDQQSPQGTTSSTSDQQPHQGQQSQQGSSNQTSMTRRTSPQLEWLSPSPFTMMRRLAEDMDRVFENFGFGRSGFGMFTSDLMQSALGSSPMQQMWSPQLEVLEQNGQLLVRADLPGLNKDDVQVEIMDNTLMLRGERKQEHEEKRQGMYRSERSYGSFSRSIPLPEGVDTEGVQANFKDGVLEITLPVSEQKQRRQITIQ
jgi:HSP20 family protein